MLSCEKVRLRSWSVRRYWKVSRHALSDTVCECFKSLSDISDRTAKTFGSSWFYALTYVFALDKDRGCDMGSKSLNLTRAENAPRSVFPVPLAILNFV